MTQAHTAAQPHRTSITALPNIGLLPDADQSPRAEQQFLPHPA
jgi:hypothetical protein